jgi:hypothetical protein
MTAHGDGAAYIGPASSQQRRAVDGMARKSLSAGRSAGRYVWNAALAALHARRAQLSWGVLDRCNGFFLTGIATWTDDCLVAGDGGSCSLGHW